MAYKRRSQEEKNLKVLRELASLPANKQCFDCSQRGPTYVNVTIGSFVCTSCSGILRGLNPPHRVKSITMTTFLPEEIELIRNRGNEYCSYVWLGTYKGSSESDSKDEHRNRDFLIQKYEKKRWFVEPEIALKKLQLDQRQNHQITQPQPPPPQQTHQPFQTTSKAKTLSHQVSVPESKTSPLPSLVIPNSQLLQSQPLSLWPHVNPPQSSLDLFSADLFSSPASSSANLASTTNNTANGNFANFESAFSSAASPPSSSLHHRKLYTPPPPVGWTSFDEEQFPPSNNMPRPLSLPTFSPSNPFSTPFSSVEANNVAAPAGRAPSPTWSSPPTVQQPANTYPLSMANNSVNSSNSGMNLLAPTLKNATTNNLLNNNNPVQAPIIDRYAALADLDSLFHSSSSSTSDPITTSTKPDAFIENFNEIHITSDTEALFSPPSSNPFSSTPWNPPSANPFQGYFTAPLNNREATPHNGINQFHQNGTLTNWTNTWGASATSQPKMSDLNWPTQRTAPSVPSLNANPFLTWSNIHENISSFPFSWLDFKFKAS